jgi:AraC family transcriptional regulator
MIHLEPPALIKSEAVRIVGLSERCSWESVIKIPVQWQRFMPYMSAIPDRLDRMPVGVSHAADDEGQFEYICGVEVARFGENSPGLKNLEIPPRPYAVFQHRGHISTVRETYLAIWNKALPEPQPCRPRRAHHRTTQSDIRPAHGRRRHRHMDPAGDLN